MKTVKISAAAYDQALAFCNARREELGLSPPITELPAGKGFNPDSCPCANTCNGKIKVFAWDWFFTSDGIKNNSSPTCFVQEFDDKVAELIPGTSNWNKGTVDVLPIRDEKATRYES